MKDLTGYRIMIVEDEAILAWEAEETLKEAGAEVIGPAHNVRDAIALIDKTEVIDAAMLDIGLNGVVSSPVAEALRLKRIPFIYTTGFAQVARTGETAVVLQKPFSATDLVTALGRLLAGSSKRS